MIIKLSKSRWRKIIRGIAETVAASKSHSFQNPYSVYLMNSIKHNLMMISTTSMMFDYNQVMKRKIKEKPVLQLSNQQMVLNSPLKQEEDGISVEIEGKNQNLEYFGDMTRTQMSLNTLNSIGTCTQLRQKKRIFFQKSSIFSDPIQTNSPMKYEDDKLDTGRSCESQFILESQVRLKANRSQNYYTYFKGKPSSKINFSPNLPKLSDKMNKLDEHEHEHENEQENQNIDGQYYIDTSFGSPQLCKRRKTENLQ